MIKLFILSFFLAVSLFMQPCFCQELSQQIEERQEFTERESQIYQEYSEQAGKIMDTLPEAEHEMEINNLIRELADKYGLSEEAMKDITKRGFYYEMKEMYENWWGDDPK